MLSHVFRIPSSDIRQVMRSRSRVRSGILEIVMQEHERSDTRFAFIVSTAIDKRATRRNRIKRLLRESVRHLIPLIRTKGDYLVVARRNISEMSQQGVEAAVRELLLRGGAL